VYILYTTDTHTRVIINTLKDKRTWFAQLPAIENVVTHTVTRWPNLSRNTRLIDRIDIYLITGWDKNQKLSLSLAHLQHQISFSIFVSFLFDFNKMSSVVSFVTDTIWVSDHTCHALTHVKTFTIRNTDTYKKSKFFFGGYFAQTPTVLSRGKNKTKKLFFNIIYTRTRKTTHTTTTTRTHHTVSEVSE
jgi:hypothetical protein